MTDFIFNISQGDIIYDIETYPNCITFYAVHCETEQQWCFEFSQFKNETSLFVKFLETLKKFNCRMVGFNNYNFDYPVIHFWYKHSHWVEPKDVYDKAMSIINSYDDRFSHVIWDNDHIVPQIDLFKIHHFDNKARSTSLKVLEFNMRSSSVEGLPFDVGINLNEEQIKKLIEYNRYDVLQTLKFYKASLDKIRFREELSEKYNKNFLNHNDTKIGKDYFIMKLEENQPGSCYKKIDGKRQVVQTIRPFITLSEVVLPYIDFQHPEFKRILNFFKNKTITETKGVFQDVSCTVEGFKFDFGTGGIHGSVQNKIFNTNDEFIIIDADVLSYYPSLAIINKFYPEHLGEKFCEIYKDVYEQRKSYPKGTSENAMLKLALNGVYGDSNNQYSPFYDPQYTMSITINGQLLLCMLCEQLFKIPKLQLISANTDGVCCYVPRCSEELFYQLCENWSKHTGLTLEFEKYRMMAIRDVNNYLGETLDD